MVKLIKYEIADDIWRFSLGANKGTDVNPTQVVGIGWWSSDPNLFPHLENHFIAEEKDDTLKFLWLTSAEVGEGLHGKMRQCLNHLRDIGLSDWNSGPGSIYRMDAGNGAAIMINYPLIREALRDRVDVHVSSPGAVNEDASDWLVGRCPIPVDLIRYPDAASGDSFSTDIVIPEQFSSQSGYEFRSKFMLRTSELGAFIAGERTSSAGNDFVTRAALFETLDGGRSWHEVSWSLDICNSFWPPHLFLANLFSWPPGMITGIRIENGNLAIYFEDDVPERVPELKIVLNPRTQKWTLSRLSRPKWL